MLGLTFGDSAAYLVANNQFHANHFYVTASTNQKRDVLSRDGEVWGSESSLGSVSLLLTSGKCYRGSVLVSSNPPVPLLIGRRGSASFRVITIGRLVVERCSSLIPVIDSIFKVELASLRKIIRCDCFVYFTSKNCHPVNQLLRLSANWSTYLYIQFCNLHFLCLI